MTSPKKLPRSHFTAQMQKTRAIKKSLQEKQADVYASRLRRVYGMSIQEYNEMYSRQQGVCSICNKGGKLVVDHNHETGNVRALLCTRCNIMVGYAESKDYDDIIEYIHAVKEYIVKHNTGTT